MRTLYIGGQSKKKGSVNWKLYTFLVLFLVVAGFSLKVSAPFLAERWINNKGTGDYGYAFSIRDLDLSFGKGEITLKDVKVFNPKSSVDILETPSVTIQVNWSDLIHQDKKFKVTTDKVDLILSQDFVSEIERIKAVGEKNREDLYLNAVEAKIGNLNIIEQKADVGRKVMELNDVSLKLKEVSLLSINKKTEFVVTSKVADGGKLDLTGQTSDSQGGISWAINGSMKNVSTDILNKIAGDKLPFSFNESHLDAVISAQSENGKVKGEISPDVKRLNLLVEKPGHPTQSIARALSEELTFTLPFTLKDGLKVQYADTFMKLKNYRKYPAASSSEVQVSQNDKSEKASFWPF